jgi:hypothetical protein
MHWGIDNLMADGMGDRVVDLACVGIWAPDFHILLSQSSMRCSAWYFSSLLL